MNGLQIESVDPSELPAVEQLQRGMLSKSDARKLAKLVGALSFAQWIDDGGHGTYRLTDSRLLLVCAVRQRALANAQLLARHASWLLVSEVAR
jgi:hypothetical protein